MKIAIPVAGGKLCMHFGHSEEFLFFEIDEKNKKITNQTSVSSPPHQPGMLPQWIKEHGATVVITGGMGMRAKQIFNQLGITVITGALESEPNTLINNYLNDTLKIGDNVCNH